MEVTGSSPVAPIHKAFSDNELGKASSFLGGYDFPKTRQALFGGYDLYFVPESALSVTSFFASTSCHHPSIYSFPTALFHHANDKLATYGPCWACRVWWVI